MKKEKNYVFWFILITLSWTWLVGFIPLMFGIKNETVQDILFKALAGPTPSILGGIFVLCTFSKEKKKDYLKRCFSVKLMGWFIPLIVMIGYALVCALSILVSTKLFNGSVPEFAGAKDIAARPYMIFLYIFFMLISGPLNEELGWRGYALEPLMKKFGFWGGSIVLGIVWAVWHLPWYFYPANGQYIAWNEFWLAGIFMGVHCITCSCVISIVYFKRNRSAILSAFIHMISNAFLGGSLIYPFDNTYIVVSIFVVTIVEFIFLLFFIFNKNFKKECKAKIETLDSDGISSTSLILNNYDMD